VAQEPTRCKTDPTKSVFFGGGGVFWEGDGKVWDIYHAVNEMQLNPTHYYMLSYLFYSNQVLVPLLLNIYDATFFKLFIEHLSHVLLELFHLLVGRIGNLCN
jgi:hypothetical protein